MKTRILPVIGFTFALLMINRTVAFSADVPAVRIAVTPTEAIPLAPDKCLTGIILDTITADMARINLRNQEISKRETTLAAIEGKLATQMTAIEAANIVLKTNIESMTSIADGDIKHLVEMYQTMKPKEAADIFNSMDPAFAAGFLRQMKSDNAGFIMANMDARKSYSISLIIAGQNATYRTKAP